MQTQIRRRPLRRGPDSPRGPAAALFTLLLAGLVGAGCSAPAGTEQPALTEIHDALCEVLCEGRPEVEQMPLAVRVEPEEEPAYYREADDADRARLYSGPPLAGIEVAEVRSRRYPAWRTLFYVIADGQRLAPLLADVVPIEGRLHVVIHLRPARRSPDGTLVPDFSPNPTERKIEEVVGVTAFPPWAIDPR